MIVATPHYAKDVAIELARIDGEVFDALQGEHRDRYYAYAAWVTDDYLTADEFHEGCMPEDAADDMEEAAFEAGYEKATHAALNAIGKLGQAATNPEVKTWLREAYTACRGTESGEAMRAMTAAYRSERRAAAT